MGANMNPGIARTHPPADASDNVRKEIQSVKITPAAIMNWQLRLAHVAPPRHAASRRTGHGFKALRQNPGSRRPRIPGNPIPSNGAVGLIWTPKVLDHLFSALPGPGWLGGRLFSRHPADARGISRRNTPRYPHNRSAELLFSFVPRRRGLMIPATRSPRRNGSPHCLGALTPLNLPFCGFLRQKSGGCFFLLRYRAAAPANAKVRKLETALPGNYLWARGLLTADGLMGQSSAGRPIDPQAPPPPGPKEKLTQLPHVRGKTARGPPMGAALFNSGETLTRQRERSKPFCRMPALVCYGEIVLHGTFLPRETILPKWRELLNNPAAPEDPRFEIAGVARFVTAFLGEPVWLWPVAV